jgi:hypothetical protein
MRIIVLASLLIPVASQSVSLHPALKNAIDGARGGATVGVSLAIFGGAARLFFLGVRPFFEEKWHQTIPAMAAVLGLVGMPIGAIMGLIAYDKHKKAQSCCDCSAQDNLASQKAKKEADSEKVKTLKAKTVKPLSKT